MKDLIKRNLEGRKILVLFIITSAIYIFMLAVTIPSVVKLADGMKLPDMMPFGYDHEYINSLLNTLGENGRNAYLYRQLPVDMIYPLLFGITYCLLFAFVLKKMGNLESSWFYFSYLPLLAALFDYIENFGFISMLNNFPENTALLTAITNVFSILKSSATTIFFIVLVVAIVIWRVRIINPKKG